MIDTLEEFNLSVKEALQFPRDIYNNMKVGEQFALTHQHSFSTSSLIQAILFISRLDNVKVEFTGDMQLLNNEGFVLYRKNGKIKQWREKTFPDLDYLKPHEYVDYLNKYLDIFSKATNVDFPHAYIEKQIYKIDGCRACKYMLYAPSWIATKL